MIPFRQYFFFFLSFFQIFAVYRMPGSQHVYEEPGFRHSLSNCQVGCFSIWLFFIRQIHLLIISFYYIVSLSTAQGMHQHRLWNGRSKNGRQKAKSKFFWIVFFFRSFIRLINVLTSVTCHSAPPFPCSFLWRSGQSQALLPGPPPPPPGLCIDFIDFLQLHPPVSRRRLLLLHSLTSSLFSSWNLIVSLAPLLPSSNLVLVSVCSSY